MLAFLFRLEDISSNYWYLTKLSWGSRWCIAFTSGMKLLLIYTNILDCIQAASHHPLWQLIHSRHAVYFLNFFYCYYNGICSLELYIPSPAHLSIFLPSPLCLNPQVLHSSVCPILPFWNIGPLEFLICSSNVGFSRFKSSVNNIHIRYLSLTDDQLWILNLTKLCSYAPWEYCDQPKLSLAVMNLSEHNLRTSRGKVCVTFFSSWQILTCSPYISLIGLKKISVQEWILVKVVLLLIY